ncbi:hypothetical protein QJQ45_002829 [Haematococcus lacustris]|nr:hypothetical protein QJQ45_002829 [Haematococcus lacustris]
MALVAEHDVVLLAPNGREQTVALRITRAGVQLATLSEKKNIHRFAFEVIKKWLPASLRSRNPGPADCLDLQIETDKGPRDLRMRTSSTQTVQNIIDELKETVLDIMREMEEARSDNPDSSLKTSQDYSSQSGQLTSSSISHSMGSDDTSSSRQPSFHQAATQGRADTPTVTGQRKAQLRMQAVGAAVHGSEPSHQDVQRTSAHPLDRAEGHVSQLAQPAAARNMPPGPTQPSQGPRPGAIATSAPQGGLAAAQHLTNSINTGEIQPLLQQTQQQPRQPPQQAVAGSGSGWWGRSIGARQPSRGGEAGELAPAPRQDSFGPDYVNVAFAPRAAPSPLGYPTGPAHASFSYFATSSTQRAAQSDSILAQAPQGAPGAGQPGLGGQQPGPRPDLLPQLAARAAGSLEVAAAATASAAEAEARQLVAESRAAALEHQVEELSVQNSFLEGLVQRVMTELASHQALRGSSSPSKAAAEVFSESSAPLPAWLKDRRHLNPLLAAYDDKLAVLEASLAGSTDGMARLQRQVRPQSQPPSSPHCQRSPGAQAGCSCVCRSCFDIAIVVHAVLRCCQVEVVVAENEKLQASLAKAKEASSAATAKADAAQGADAGTALLREENDLLRQASVLGSVQDAENELLVSAQAEVDQEMQRLHRQAEEAAGAKLRAVKEHASMIALLQQHATAAQLAAQQLALPFPDFQEAELQATRLQAALKSSEARASKLSAQLTQTQSQLEDAQVAAEGATRQLAGLQAALAQAQAEASTATQQARTATDTQAILQVEVSSLKERYEVAAAEGAAARREGEALRGALASVESRLSEYKLKDAEVYGRIREAMEAAEAARLARDSSTRCQHDLERELEAVSAKLTAVRKNGIQTEQCQKRKEVGRQGAGPISKQQPGSAAPGLGLPPACCLQAVRDQVYAELQGQLHAQALELANLKEELKAAQDQVYEHKAASERAARDASSLSAELTALKEDLGETLSSKSRVTLMSLSTMERIQEVEQERDEAVQALDSRNRQLERQQREWALERQSLESELRTLRKAVAELESSVSTAKGEVAGYARQTGPLARWTVDTTGSMKADAIWSEALGREVANLREAKIRAEAELRHQLSAAREERDAEVKAMAQRMEAAISSCAKSSVSLCERSVAEAERMIESKDALLARWKEEAQGLHSVTHAHQLALTEVEALRGALPEMQAALLDAEERSSQLHMQLLAAGNREEELEQEIRSLHGQLERAIFENKRPERARDPLTEKFEALKARAGDGQVVVGRRGGA